MTNDELKKLAQKILEDAFVMSLGVADEEGVWVSDLTYVHDDDFCLYWISSKETRHSKAIALNGAAACTIAASLKPHRERALQIAGTAQKIEGPLFEFEKKLNLKRGKSAPEIAGQILQNGFSWYLLKPTRIELHHSIPFEKERQTIIL